MTPDRLYTIADAAQALGITKKAMRGRVDRGRVQVQRGPDGIRLIPHAELERIAHELDARRPMPPSLIADTASSIYHRDQAPTDDHPADIPRVVVDVNHLFAQGAEAMARAAELAAWAAEQQVTAARATERAALDRRARHAAEAEVDRLRAALTHARAELDTARRAITPPPPPPPPADTPPSNGTGGTLTRTTDHGGTLTRASSHRRGWWARLTGRTTDTLTAAPA